VLVALAAPLIAPHDPLEQDLMSAQLPRMDQVAATRPISSAPTVLAAAFVALIYSARTAVAVALVAATLAAAIGIVLGLVAGSFGG